MLPLMEMLTQGTNGQLVEQIARQYQLSNAQAQQAMEALVPAFSSFTINNGDGAGNFSANSGNTLTVLYPGDQATFTATYTVLQDDVDYLQ